ncbi:hypothetical protein F3Y22_tig00110745pilonHSYRG00070 [Hibiscus syriacus]|uniref:Uncharacterized protein n=1 Tax=Hibiscus syriacus TaxID=106335 RepID=A0A6A2ZSV6_HIBSY|nr:hypothetical protein F3Y22_tig00110745pilonHSYRG00070 [Hibiscus syriacus]
MGNCVVVGLGEANKVIRVTTSNGGVMEFSTPIKSGSITSEFPGHAIFPSNANDILGKPLLHHEHLLPAKSYYLLPRNTKDTTSGNRRAHHVRSNSVPASLVVPYRMTQATLKRSHTDVFSRYRYNHHHPGVWKVNNTGTAVGNSVTRCSNSRVDPEC